MPHEVLACHWRRRSLQTLLPVLSLILAAPHSAVAQPPPCHWTGSVIRHGYPLPSGTGEASGLAASSRFPGWGWMIRDSGHPPSLYVVRFRGRQGHVIREVKVIGADNTDWEDIAYARNPDGTGRLYVIESGQSGRDRFIYKVPEPDPDGPLRAIPSRRFRYAYPGNRHYNTEAAFFHQSRLVLVTKTAPARLYRFEERLSPGRVNRPRFIGTLRGSPRVSVARVSPDGRTLVTANHNWLYVYRATSEDADLAHFIARRAVRRERVGVGDNVEAGDFFPAGDCDLVLVAESRNVYRVLSRGEPGPGDAGRAAIRRGPRPRPRGEPAGCRRGSRRRPGRRS